MLRDRLGDSAPEEVGQLLRALERGTLRLTHLIDNLLESVRIEAGEDSIRRRAVSLDEVVQEAAALMSPLLEQKDQSLTVELPHPLPAVTGDAPRLVQVFVNLLANATKFAPEGSEIRIGGAVGEAEIALHVEDDGPGLPPGGSIFGRFARGAVSEDEEEPEQSGMGLGLWIVRSVVERHGGRVEARTGARELAASPAGGGEGKEARRGPGTRVSVILPRGRHDEGPGRRR